MPEGGGSSAIEVRHGRRLVKLLCSDVAERGGVTRSQPREGQTDCKRDRGKRMWTPIKSSSPLV